MKFLIITFSLLIPAFICSEETKFNKINLYNDLEYYKWKKRILLLIAHKEDIALLNQVNKFFITQKCKNDERNLKLLKIIKKNSFTQIPEYFQNKTGIWLIGYDGYIKAFSKDNSLLSDVYNLIDNMPIGKEKKKEFKSKC